MTKCSYTRAPREGKIKSRDFFSTAGDLEGALGENRQVSIRFPSPPLARVRAESGAREGFLGDITSDTMFEAFYKTAMSVRAASRPPGSEAAPRRTARGSNDKIHPHALE